MLMRYINKISMLNCFVLLVIKSYIAALKDDRSMVRIHGFSFFLLAQLFRS